MKIKILLWLVPFAFVGCAGYNHTLFMTKSNVGLDFDSKPPTLEINVSRKEAVIAPSFEGGKTPPVMASFKPSAGAGGSFGSFFMGVDQTFAGGDAALAMAQLYNQPTATDINKFNSELELSKKPGYTDPFRKIPDAGATRPLIFGTDTSLGLKVAWSGAGGQFPDTVKLGFNRKEFAWAPLTATPRLKTDGTQDGEKVNVKMPAFLATVESSQKLDTNGTRVEALQYFATGDSATYLAMRKEVRAAMHARLDPNTQAYKSKFGERAQSVLGHTLFAVQTILDDLAKQGDAAALALRSKLNKLDGVELPDKVGTQKNPVYSYNTNDLSMEWNVAGERPLPVPADLDVIKNYLFGLERSLAALQTATRDLAADKTIQLIKNGAAAAPITKASPEAALLHKDLPLVEAKLLSLRSALSSNRDVVAAYRHVEAMISPQ